MWYWLESNWEFCCLFLLTFLILELIWDEAERLLALLPKAECQPALATAKTVSFPPELDPRVGLPPEYEAPVDLPDPKPKKKRNGWKSKEAPELGEIIEVRDNTAKAWRQRRLISIDDEATLPFLCEEGTKTRRYRLGRVCKKRRVDKSQTIS